MRQGLAGEISYREGTMGLVRAKEGFFLKGLMLAAALLALAAFAAPTVQGDERVLDAELSLIGGCAEPEALDPVPDPGCPEGIHPPSGKFADPRAVTTDFYGNIYVSSFGKLASGAQGRIDIFTPEGIFISERKIAAPMSVAVDSEGNLYVITEVAVEGGPTERRLSRLEPTGGYEPEAGKIEYGGAPIPLSQDETTLGSLFTGLAINVETDHLFANFGGGGLVEYDSAAAGNGKVGVTPMPLYPYGVGVAVDAARDRLYATVEDERIDIFDLTKVVEGSQGRYEKIGSIEESDVPQGNFGGYLSTAVDERNGNIFVLDGKLNVLYQFAFDGTYLATTEHAFQEPFGAEIGIDNGPFSPNKGYLYVPSGKSGTGHSYAFEESSTRGPEVKSIRAAGITQSEAEIQADINSGNLVTSYTVEYTTEKAFLEKGFEGASIAGSGQLPAENLDQEAAAPVAGLQPGTKYLFRIVVSNEKGPDDEMEGSFSTYPSFVTDDTTQCPNESLRIGFSHLLPDCRAYELVTPADTNGRAPLGIGREGGTFATRQVSPAGDKVPFRVEGGTLPGSGGTGSYLGDPFLSTRGAEGWSSAFIGPSAAEAVAITPGWTSPDQGYSFWTAENKGSALYEGKSTSFLRFPDGHSEILGEGSIGIDPEALGQLISENGSHVLFATGAGASPGAAVQLEPDAAPSGTQAIYDRTSDGVVHVVSLKPGDVPFGSGEKAISEGMSLDGKGVAFRANNSTLYLRYQNEETFKIGDGVDFAGIAEGGNLLFYLDEGRLWRFDALTGDRIPFSDDEVTPVNVSTDGSTAYFVSTEKLTTEANSSGDLPVNGKQNLYLSREGAIRFVATVTDRDVEGKFNGTAQVDGLGLWLTAVSRKETTPGRFGIDPSRTTPDGGVLLFQSRAPLTGYDPEGHSEVYRYDGVDLHCLSCNPTGAPASGDAHLQSENREGFALFFSLASLQNLRPDGRRAIFESPEALVPGDSDGKQDVYEWEDDGVGDCATASGCISLISSGHSSRADYLYAVSESGNDVFFLSTDLLLPADQDETPSIYDARVGGGFPEAAEAECQGEGCRPQLTPSPSLPGVQTPIQGPGENFKPHRRCGKGKRKVKRAGKVRCVKKHSKHHSKKAGSNRKGGSK